MNPVLRPIVFGLVIVLVAVGCSSDDQPVAGTGTPSSAPTTSAPAGCEPAASAASPASTLAPAPTTTAPPATTSTAAPATTVAATPLAPGDSGAAVRSMQERLSALGYWLGPVDGQYGSSTSHAITAFEKVEGMTRDGIADIEVQEGLAGARRPGARSSTGRVIEIDLGRQVLLVVTDGAVDLVLDTATGASATPTPLGEYAVYREIDGYRHAPLGTLYRPKYINGGIAIHGFTSVPSQPASHGCVRVTYPAMDHIWGNALAPLGTPVWVY